jgi:hypothetical protein
MQNLGMPEHPVTAHQLVEYIKDLLLAEFTILLTTEVLQCTIGAVLHKDVVVVLGVAF